jgi:putative membrane protein
VKGLLLHEAFTSGRHAALGANEQWSGLMAGAAGEERVMGYLDMMSGWGGAGSGWVMYLGMIALWAGIVAVIVLAVRIVAGPHATQATQSHTAAAPQCSAIDVLKRRYAAGEIDAAEFEQKKHDLA